MEKKSKPRHPSGNISYCACCSTLGNHMSPLHPLWVSSALFPDALEYFPLTISKNPKVPSIIQRTHNPCTGTPVHPFDVPSLSCSDPWNCLPARVRPPPTMLFDESLVTSHCVQSSFRSVHRCKFSRGVPWSCRSAA